MAIVALNKGRIALIDDGDAELVATRRWYVTSAGYVESTTDRVLLHRFLTQAPRGLDVDHRDGDPLNNRRANLRVCTHAVNQQNRKGANKNNANGHRNVYYDKRDKRWFVRVIAYGKAFNGGRFASREEAVEAACQLRARVLA